MTEYGNPDLLPGPILPEPTIKERFATWLQSIVLGPKDSVGHSGIGSITRFTTLPLLGTFSARIATYNITRIGFIFINQGVGGVYLKDTGTVINPTDPYIPIPPLSQQQIILAIPGLGIIGEVYGCGDAGHDLIVVELVRL